MVSGGPKTTRAPHVLLGGGGGGRRKETRSGRNRTATDTLEARALAQTRYLERMAIPVELSKETRGEAKQGSQRAADEKGMQW